MTRAEKEIRNQKIVELRKQGYSQRQLSDMYELSRSAVEQICKRYGVAGKLSNRKANYDLLPQLHRKPSEDYAREVIEQKLNGFLYFGNYTGSSGTADIQCKACGYIFTQPFITIRQGKRVWCRNCEKLVKERKQAKIQNERKKRISDRQKRQSEIDLDLFLTTYQVECKVCGKIFVTRNKNIRCCSKVCSRIQNNRTCSQRKDKRITKEKRVDRGITAKRLYNRDGGVCWICGGKCDLNDYIVRNNVIICGDRYPSVDHVIPISEGGEDAWSNVRLAHRKCNSMRYFGKFIPSLSDADV